MSLPFYTTWGLCGYSEIQIIFYHNTTSEYILTEYKDIRYTIEQKVIKKNES